MSVSQAKRNDETQKNDVVCAVCGSENFIEKNGLKICAFCSSVVGGNAVGDATEKFVPSCPFCGGSDFDREDDVLICRHCGESYFFEDLNEGARRSDGESERDDNCPKDDGIRDKNRSADTGNAFDVGSVKFYAPPESLTEKIKNAKKEEPERSGERTGRGNDLRRNDRDGVIRKLRVDGQNENSAKENVESLTLGFLDAVSRLNETAYDLVDGNANVWARTAYEKNIIGREEKSEVGRIVAKRNRIAHGFGGKVRATRQDVDGAKKYYDVMIKTKNRIV